MGHTQQVGHELEFAPVPGQNRGSQGRGVQNKRTSRRAGLPPTSRAAAIGSYRSFAHLFPAHRVHGDGQGAPIRGNAQPTAIRAGGFHGRAGRRTLDADDGV